MPRLRVKVLLRPQFKKFWSFLSILRRQNAFIVYANCYDETVHDNYLRQISIVPFISSCTSFLLSSQSFSGCLKETLLFPFQKTQDIIFETANLL